MRKPKILAVFLFLCASSAAHADLFPAVELYATLDQFNRFVDVYHNMLDAPQAIHMQARNDDCESGTVIKVVNRLNQLVKKVVIPGVEARAVSLRVPAQGRIRIQFIHGPQDPDFETVFKPVDCDSTQPNGVYTLSEPIGQ